MNKLNNFLLKLFAITVALTCNMGGVAFAEEGSENPTDKNWGLYSKGNTGTEQIFCQTGQYVYSCGAYNVGYNWLNSVTLTTPNGTIRETSDYNIGEDAFDKMEQMRAFFNKDRVVKYKSSSGTVNTTNSSEEKVQLDRDFILGLVCNPLDPTVTIRCAPCPDGGTVKASSVKVGNDINQSETSLLLIHDSWNFHTIADCYVTEFEDAFGSFIYTSPVVADTDVSGEECYYTNTSAAATKFIAGDDISSAVFGGNAGNVQSVTPDIPE